MKRISCCLLAALLTLCLLLSSSAAEPPEETGGAAQSAAEQSYSTLKYGSKGEAVIRLQQRLKELGYLSDEADGQFGTGTKGAVKSFQRLNGLDEDGIAGPKTLEKLYSEDAVAAPQTTPTDVLADEVPMLVNKDNPVPGGEFFVPADLVQVSDILDSNLIYIKYAGTKGVRTALEALKTMLLAAKADGVGKWQMSAGYRTWEMQVQILNSKIVGYRQKHEGWSYSRARREALRTVAEPGCSEHHLGLAFDVNVKGASSFAGTKQSRWLNQHCWDYGFIIRYQEDKAGITGIDNEPWHIRYVGTEHSLYMKEHNLCLEEYVQGIVEGTIRLPADRAEESEETSDTEEPEAGETDPGVEEIDLDDPEQAEG